MSETFERAALLEIDRDAGATYITVGDQNVARTATYEGSVSLDIDSDGYVVGIEFLTELHVR